MNPTPLTELLDRHVRAGTLPGAVAAVASGDDLDVAVVGARGLDGPPMTRDTIFRIASLTKPITAAAAMVLVDEGLLGLDDPVGALAARAGRRRWWCARRSRPVDDVVPARRPITVRDLLTFRSGHGFPSDFSLPAVRACCSTAAAGSAAPQGSAPRAGRVDGRPGRRIPLLHQPGEAWLYNTGSDILGVLVARVGGQPVRRVPGRADLRAARHARHRLPRARGDLDRFTTATTGRDEGGSSRSPTRPTASGARAPAVPGRVPAAWSSTADDLLPSSGCCWRGRRRACSRPRSRCALMTTDHLTRRPTRGEHRSSWRARAGGSAAASTSSGPSRGTCPAATAGSAAPVRPRTSTPWVTRITVLLTTVGWRARRRPRSCGSFGRTPPRSGPSLGVCAARCSTTSTRRSGSPSARFLDKEVVPHHERVGRGGHRRRASCSRRAAGRASSAWPSRRSSAAAASPTSGSTR